MLITARGQAALPNAPLQVRICCLTALVTMLAGCGPGTYIAPGISGQDLSKVAVLFADSGKEQNMFLGANEVVTIVRINEKSLVNMKYNYMYPQRAIIEPGRYQIQVRYQHMAIVADVCLELSAIAGKTYIIRKKAARYRVLMWLEDYETSTVVGGLCGHEPISDESATGEIKI